MKQQLLQVWAQLTNHLHRKKCLFISTYKLSIQTSLLLTYTSNCLLPPFFSLCYQINFLEFISPTILFYLLEYTNSLIAQVGWIFIKD